MKRILLSVMAFAIVAIWTPLVQAGAFWNNLSGDNMWNTIGNWSVTPVNAIPQFNSAAPAGTIFFNADMTVSRVRAQFNTPARTITIAATNTADATLTILGSSETFDFIQANNAITFDGTPNGNGARMKLQINNTGTFVRVTNATLNLNLDISGVGAIRSDSGGTLTLGGVNTYQGNTTVSSAGTISLSDNARLTFYIGANGVNNKVTYEATTGGTVNLDGDFSFDLSLADLTSGNSWNIVDVANLNEVFGSTFSVLGGFTESSDIWTWVDGDNTWTFTENTGLLQLTVVPEPSTVALALLGGLGLWMVARRRSA